MHRMDIRWIDRPLLAVLGIFLLGMTACGGSAAAPASASVSSAGTSSASTSPKPGGSSAAGSPSAGTSAAASTNAPFKMRLAFTQGHATLPVHAAQENGYFKDNGLDVTTTEGVDLPTYMASLDRQFDITMTVTTIYINGISQGIKAKIISGMQLNAENPLSNPLITKQPGIQSLKDMPGKTVGSVSLTGSGTMALQYLLKKGGMDPASIKLIQVPFDQQADQLNAGRIDSAISAPPFYVGPLANGYRSVVDTSVAASREASGDPKMVSANAFFIASDSFIAQHPDVYKAFKKSIQQGTDWVYANEPASRQMMQSWMRLTPEVAKASPVPAMNSNLDPSQVQPWITIMREMGAIKGDFPDAKSLFAP